jgi:cell division septation protein DedD
MRHLFFVLVLANLGVAAWSAWFAPLHRVGHRADEGLPSITLFSEVPADLRSTGAVAESVAAAGDAAASAGGERSDAAAPDLAASDTAAPDVAAEDVVDAASAGAEQLATAADPVTTGGAARCTSVGPFRELSQAANATATLRATGYQPTQRVAEGDIWIGYWVYIQAIPTEDEANAILAKVRAEGIGDSYVIPNSDSGNLVSLGVFSEISGVSRRRDQVRALGLEPQVVDRTRRATVYWVDVSLGAEQTLDFDALQPPGRIIRLEQRDCESPLG